MKLFFIVFFIFTFFSSTKAYPGEIGFIESFSLAEDRSIPLKQLIPGTEDYYYYHSLHYQHQGQNDKVEGLLKQWIKRYGYTRRVKEIQNRQALLRYDKNPIESLAFISDRLSLKFNHRKETADKKTNYPTTLDQKLIGFEKLAGRSFKKYRGLQGFEDSALELLANKDIDPSRRRDLLSRIMRPDIPHLPELVAADLKYKHSAGFGSLQIHNNLLLSQLDACLNLMPGLINNGNFINAYIQKLRPSPDLDWQNSPKDKEAYLDRLWAFVNMLSPAHNSLKTHVLYEWLKHDTTRGVYNQNRFNEYIKLPKNVFYINSKFIQRPENRNYRANLNYKFKNITLLPDITNDEPLVREYLLHFFIKQTSWSAYLPYFRDNYLKEVFAEAKILNGLGDPERWFSMMPIDKYLALKERVDIDFASDNQLVFGANDSVSLKGYIKNVKKLVVKIYDINTFNYYQDRKRDIHLGINLDGLIPNKEIVFNYDEGPLRRVLREFNFPLLKQRSVYIVEFIGNGKSSRALIKKGRLKYIEKKSTAGHIFTILNDTNQKVTKGSIWLDGRLYKAEKDGSILIPFTNKPGKQPIILIDGDFSSLENFYHNSENYSLTAGIYVDREGLLKNKKTKVIIRPVLYLNNKPVTISLLNNSVLIIESFDIEDVKTIKEIKEFKLFDNKESTYEFKVSENLSRLKFILKGEVQSLSKNKKINLSGEESFLVNGIEKTEKIMTMNLGRINDSYILNISGKNGEAISHMPSMVKLKHRHFTAPVHLPMQTDGEGRIYLGKLKNIRSITAENAGAQTQTWFPVKNQSKYPAAIHSNLGEIISIPYMGEEKHVSRFSFSLLEKRGGGFVKDYFKAMKLKDGFLLINGLPGGDYDLLLKERGVAITLRVTKGKKLENYLLSDYRFLEIKNPAPLQIKNITLDSNNITIRLANSGKHTRAHIFGSRFIPDFSVFQLLGKPYFTDPLSLRAPKSKSRYLSGRKIGDEYSYIINRKYTKKYPGNMLKRPGLLLNPFSLRKTETKEQTIAEGEPLVTPKSPPLPLESRAFAKKRISLSNTSFANLDYLKTASLALINLRPDKDGMIVIDRKKLGDSRQIHVLAVDPQNTVYRELSLSRASIEHRDIRLTGGLDYEKRFTEKKQVSILGPGESFTLQDFTTSQFEVYDSLGRIFSLLLSINSNPNLLEFNFILDWPELTSVEKQKKYLKYASHELHFFLYKKDPLFFNQVVTPYLKNKKNKTFMDHWLLKDDLIYYLQAWNYSQLNGVEKILLAQQVSGEERATASYVSDLYDFIPPDPDRWNTLFKIALRGSSLDTSDRFELEANKLDFLRSDLQRKKGDKELFLGGLSKRAQIAKSMPAARKPKSKMEEKISADISREAGEFGFADDIGRRERVKQFYRKLDKTKEWVENNYYKLPLEEQNGELVTINAFWKDYAEHGTNAAPFLSTNIAEASRNFTEMMFALSVLDIPFKAKKHETGFKGKLFRFVAGSPVILYHKEIKETLKRGDSSPVLVSQNYFRHNDRFYFEGNERFDKYVTNEFLSRVVYGCQVTLTNPSSSRQKLDALLQIPSGAVPALKGFYTKGMRWTLEPYSTKTFDYYFYFPSTGNYPHFPLHVTRKEELIAFSKGVNLKVVEKLSEIDRASWNYISQMGSEKDVIRFLEQNNLNRVHLQKIAFRMKNHEFFNEIIPLLQSRHIYNHVLWSYGIYHNEPEIIREYLLHSPLINQAGRYLVSSLINIDPVIRKNYQHMEYSPLVNPRAHKLSPKRVILNERFYQQYERLMKVFSFKPQLYDADFMDITYYMLLQDRIEEAVKFFDRVNPQKLNTTIQYDYFQAYLEFYKKNSDRAKQIASMYKDYPVPRWRNLFQNVLNQVEEIEGKTPETVDRDDRTQVQTKLTSSEPGFDFSVEDKRVTINYQNIDEIEVNYYLMDIELLFSRNPFVQKYASQFSYIKPNGSEIIKLPAGEKAFTFNLPERFHNSNVLAEITSEGIKKTQAYYAHSLAIQIIENYGQIIISHKLTGKPLPGVYVKVYAQMQGESNKFYKDGYTDLRGRFDYTSLNTDEIDRVKRYSILVLSESDGAVIKEAAPPKQ